MLMKAANAFVTQSAREGFGIAVLEALACGPAVVTASAPDNLAQHLAVRSSRSIVCDPSAPGVVAAMKQKLAESGRAQMTMTGSTNRGLPNTAGRRRQAE